MPDICPCENRRVVDTVANEGQHIFFTLRSQQLLDLRDLIARQKFAAHLIDAEFGGHAVRYALRHRPSA